MTSERRKGREAEHRRKVVANEDAVIIDALRSDPKDKSARTQYVREVAEDIIARRAASN